MDDKQMGSLFSPKVVVRREGDEYLLYNRTTDQLLMLTEEGLQLLQLYAQSGDIGITAKSRSKILKQDAVETEKRVQSLVYQAAKAGILSQRLMGMQTTRGLMQPDVNVLLVSDIRKLGDLTVAAWAIAAKTAILK